MRASSLSMAGMPRASQMQLPHQECLPTSTENGVGMAEKGSAIKIAPSFWSTKARPSASLWYAARTSSGGLERALAVSCAVGGWPVLRKWV